ncbi:hypothetical protein NX794_00070 [Streptomyces sp. LP11]|uniref:Integral membrane protein n=1 Tax=Streptomyces pyxinicus TaxID=2970331 RepID=A0ABT2ATS0_9ACTN|nr:hypothetical protein [Streptomyces sp. LP11]MCS0599644.1 hypothetical protein [Streptomyces sp. LP11]
MSLIPWVVFAVIDRAAPSPQWAAASAAVAALVIAWPSLVARSPLSLDLLAIGLFVVMAVAAFLAGPHGRQIIADYGRTMATGALALFVLLTLPFAPFTTQYARRVVPRELWGTERFRRTNVVFSAVWGVAFAFMTVCHLIAAGDPGDRRLSTVCNWLLPIAAVIAVLRFMDRYRQRQTAEPGAPHRPD